MPNQHPVPLVTPQQPPHKKRRRRHPVVRLVSVAAGWVLLVVGVITTPTPVPIGLVLVAIGIFLLARDSHMARKGIRSLRKRFPALDRGLCSISHRLPRTVRAVIRRTAPLATRRHMPREPRPAATRPAASDREAA